MEETTKKLREMEFEEIETKFILEAARKKFQIAPTDGQQEKDNDDDIISILYINLPKAEQENSKLETLQKFTSTKGSQTFAKDRTTAETLANTMDAHFRGSNGNFDLKKLEAFASQRNDIEIKKYKTEKGMCILVNVRYPVQELEQNIRNFEFGYKKTVAKERFAASADQSKTQEHKKDNNMAK